MSRNAHGKVPKNSDRRADDGSTMTPVDPADSVSPRFVQFGSFTLDLARRVLSRQGERIHLTAKPLDTLIALVTHPGETVSKQELMEVVWKNTAVTEDVLVQAIGEIRRALGERTGETDSFRRFHDRAIALSCPYVVRRRPTLHRFATALPPRQRLPFRRSGSYPCRWRCSVYLQGRSGSCRDGSRPPPAPRQRTE